MTNFIPQDFLVDHLFILVGTNPLPCFVAGKLLRNKGGTIYLVYSTKTENYVNSLSTALSGCQLISLNDAARNPDKIVANMSKKSSRLTGAVGLHYTGGTKVMAVHCYRAILEKYPDAICSYLDPDRLELCFERDGKTHGSPIKLTVAATNAAVKLTLHQLWLLHNKKPFLKEHNPKVFSERTTPLIPGIAPLLARHFGTMIDGVNGQRIWEGQAWIDVFKGEKKLKDDAPITALPYQDVVDLLKQIKPDIQTIGELKNSLGSRANNYLGEGGDWLEDWVLESLQELKEKLAFNDIVCSARTQRTNKPSECEMELDVVAIRGYQLFIFSCYAGSNMDTCKAKLYEAAMRAQQLGGSEARFALVCGHSNKTQVEDQMGGTTAALSYTVFDRHDLPNLKTHIENWIREVDRETSL